MLRQIEFAYPYFFYFLLVIPLLAVWYWYRHRQMNADIRFSSTEVFETGSKSIKLYLHHGLFVLRLLAIGLMIVALARPQISLRRQDVTIEGIDIVMALDISGSMLAEDFHPNRLEAAKDVAQDSLKADPMTAWDSWYSAPSHSHSAR
jgi:Ca-activated chloride channel family protein